MLLLARNAVTSLSVPLERAKTPDVPLCMERWISNGKRRLRMRSLLEVLPNSAAMVTVEI